MKISLNTLKELTGLNLRVDELVEKINLQLGQVEEVVDLAAKYKDVVIAKVVTQEKHPDADKLSFCRIDDGGAVKDVARDENGLVEVVCGAPNVQAGQFVAWLPPKSVVPSSFNDAEPFVLDSRELRGILSHGMIASAKELDLGDDHNGIVVIAENDLPDSFKGDLSPGLSFAEAFELDDTVIELENKMFTHRPDCFGQLGVAREISGIYHQAFSDPKWYYELAETVSESDRLPLKVFNEAGDKVPRFMIVALDGVNVSRSPLWLQTKLKTLGSKSVNNVVDITNYMMLMTAQPLHAYDYDKLRGATLGVRMAKDGEKTELLNGKTYELSTEDIVIVDGEGIVGLGGVMGGLESEVTSETTRVVLECANFDMYAIRKTSMRYGLFTDAVTRFNKGQSMLMNPYIVQETLRLMSELASTKQAGKVHDDLTRDDKQWRSNPPVKPMLKARSIETDFINKRLGLSISRDEMINLLTNVGFECEASGDKAFSYWSPAWRMDIQDPEDVVEEVGRLYGFDKLNVELPRRSIAPAVKNPILETKRMIRRSLEKAGANEVLTYSFVHENTLKKAEQDVSQAFQLSNALSPDLQYYRLSVLPSLLDKVHANIKASYDEFVLYEIGKGHNKKYHADDDEGLPKEMRFVDGVYASKKPRSGAAYYRMRKLVSTLAHDLGFTLKFMQADEKLDYPVTAPFDLKRSAMVETRHGEFIGMIGELKRSVVRNFKLSEYTAAMTLDFEGLMKARVDVGRSYRPLSRFPKVTQDMSLKVSTDVSYEDLFWHIWRAVEANQPGECDTKLEPLAIYQSDDDKSHKTITLRLSIASYEKTLTDQDVGQIMEAAATAAKEKLSAERI